MSTTMALVRMLTSLLRDKNIAPRLVPIIPDEARTFGMEGFFQKIGIYAHEGQKYEPEDSEQLSSYKEDKKGQVLEEGITESGAMSSWIAAGTSYTNHDLEMIPIYTFYSMFGFSKSNGSYLGSWRFSSKRFFNRSNCWKNYFSRRRITTSGWS